MINIILLLLLGCNLAFAGWTQKTDLPIARVGATAVSFENKIYVIGGRNNNLGYMNNVDVYDPLTDSWDTTSVADLDDERANAAAVVFNGSIYVMGGKENSDVLKSVVRYDAVQNEWHEVQDMREKRDGLGAAIFNNTIVAFGGAKENGHIQDKIEWYDAANDEWTENSNIRLSPPRVAPFSFVLNDTLFVMGGFFFEPLRGSKKLTTSGDWLNGPDLGEARAEGGSAVINGKGYIIGGETTSGVSSRMEIYDPTTGMFEQGESMLSARAGFATATLGDSLFIFGGHNINPNDIVSTVEMYVDGVSGIDDRPNTRPDYFNLHQNYPNPFNGTTTISFELPHAGNVQLAVYNSTGERISEILNDELPAGSHAFQWNGINDTGINVASGVYLLLLRSGRETASQRILYLK